MTSANNIQVHRLADVTTAQIGARTRIWQFVVVLPGAIIGADCNINTHCFIGNDVVVGDRVTIMNGAKLLDGLQIANDVFVGPNVTFTNDRHPDTKSRSSETLTTKIEAGATIGGGATILHGLKIGRNAIVGSGAVVTRSVPPNAITLGNPARIVGYVDASSANNVDSPLPVIPPQETDAVAMLHQLPRVLDIRGDLSVGEFERTVPFRPLRYFIVFNVPSIETRGEHAHRACHQFLVCVRGSVSIVADNGLNRSQFLLNSPDIGLHLPPMVWGIQYKFSADAALLVFASHYYDSNDYIRDYDEFLSLVQRAS